MLFTACVHHLLFCDVKINLWVNLHSCSRLTTIYSAIVCHGVYAGFFCVWIVLRFLRFVRLYVLLYFMKSLSIMHLCIPHYVDMDFVEYHKNERLLNIITYPCSKRNRVHLDLQKKLRHFLSFSHPRVCLASYFMYGLEIDSKFSKMVIIWSKSQ